MEQVELPVGTAREEFCQYEKQAMEGWKAVSEYVEALHFFYFYSENEVEDFRFENRNEAVIWVRCMQLKMVFYTYFVVCKFSNTTIIYIFMF